MGRPTEDAPATLDRALARCPLADIVAVAIGREQPMISRRTFVNAAAGGLLAWPGVARARGPKLHRIGVLSSGALLAEQKRFDDLATGLRDLGYVEGGNIQTARRFAEGRYESLPALARELIREKVEVIVCMSMLATQAAKEATSTVPIVFATVAGPVSEGFVRSLAHLGGNLAGLASIGTDLSAKGLQLLKDTFPSTSKVVVFAAPRTPHAPASLAELERAAKVPGVALLATQLRGRDDLAAAVGRMRGWKADGIYVIQGAESSAIRPRLVQVATESGLPAVSPQRNYVDAGGLMSHGPSFEANYRRAASYVDRVLKGARPADLPVELPAKVELVVNVRTARAMGVQLPNALLSRADDVVRYTPIDVDCRHKLQSRAGAAP